MFIEYFKWHYSRGFNELVEIFRDFFSFLTHLFSFKFFARTFFSPLKRMGESYQSGLHIESALSTLLVNTIMRVVGMVARASIMIIGLIILILFVVISFIFSLVWLFMPLILIGLLGSSFFLIYIAV